MKINPLHKRLKRDFKENIGRYLAIGLMMIVTISVISAFLAVAASVEVMVDENRSKNRLEDGQFTLVSPWDFEEQPIFQELDVEVYENFYIDIELNATDTLRLYQNRTDINLVTLMDGNLPVEKDEVAIDRLFGENNDIAIGDYLGELKVTGYVALSDYSSLFENNNDILLNSFNFGVGIVSNIGFDQLSQDYDVTYNYAYLTDQVELTPKESFDLATNVKITLLQAGVNVTSIITADNNQSISFLSTDMGSDVPMMKVLLYIILAVMAFVFAVIIRHTIEREAIMIGTLLASGYSKREIINHYMSLPIIITIVSGIIGNIICYTVMLQPFLSLYYKNYSIPYCTVTLNAEALLLTTLLPVGMILVINYITLFKQLSISPLRFLRNNLKKPSKSRAMKLPKISFIGRFRLRVIIDNIRSYGMLCIGIFIASCLLMFGFCLRPLFDHYIETVEETLVADYQYILKMPVEIPDGVKTTIASMEVYKKSSKQGIEVNFMGVDQWEDQKINEGEIYFSDTLLKKLDKKKEEEVEFIDEIAEKSYLLKSTNLVEYAAGLAVVMPRKDLNQLLGYDENYFNGYMSNEPLDIGEEYIAKTITKDDMTKLSNQLLSSFQGVLAPIVIMSIMIYMVLMYILTKLAIDKNARYISYLKVFGYQNRQIRKVYLHAGTYAVIFSLVFTLPLVGAFVKVCIDLAMDKTSGYIEPYIPTYLYGVIVAIGFSSYLIINTFHVIKINKIDLTEAMKSVE